MAKTIQAQPVRGASVPAISSSIANDRPDRVEELATRAYRLNQIIKLEAPTAMRETQPSEVDLSEILYFVSGELEEVHCDFYTEAATLESCAQ